MKMNSEQNVEEKCETYQSSCIILFAWRGIYSRCAANRFQHTKQWSCVIFSMCWNAPFFTIAFLMFPDKSMIRCLFNALNESVCVFMFAWKCLMKMRDRSETDKLSELLFLGISLCLGKESYHLLHYISSPLECLNETSVFSVNARIYVLFNDSKNPQKSLWIHQKSLWQSSDNFIIV